MSIIQTVTSCDFAEAFLNSSYKNNFSRQALSVLFDYFEDLSENTNEHIEFDIVAISCDFVEYCDENDLVDDLNLDVKKDKYNEYDTKDILRELQKNTTVLNYEDGYFLFLNY